MAIALAGGGWYFFGSAERDTPAPDGTLPSRSSTPIVEPQAAAFARYSGSASCHDCHRQAHDLWADSHHGLAERPLSADLDRAAFEPERLIEHGTNRSVARVIDDSYELETLGPGDERRPFSADRVIGHEPLRQFLIDIGRGRLQAGELAYDPHQGDWFNVFGEEDRRPGEWGHWTGRGMNWNSMCATCHNTRLRKNYDEATDTYHTAFAERSVSCESCHGPMKDHVDWQRAHPDSRRADPTIRRLTADQMFDTCATCHSRRSELTGDFVPGDSWFDHHALTIVDETELYYPDGQVLEENYEMAAFLGSKMHAAGVRCMDCHEPHSARTRLEGNALCMRCHNGAYPNSPVIQPVAHSFHAEDSAGNQCVNCHMPQTVYMRRDARHDHGFTIPDPLLTKELGIPNACNRCHTEEDADWALAAVREWYGERMERPERERTRWIAAARTGGEGAHLPLMTLLQSETNAYWRAVAAGLLDRWIGEEPVASALRKALKDPHPLVRAHAARTLGPLVEQREVRAVSELTGLLDDPSRNVRLAAAWALRATLDSGSDSGRELRHLLDFQADQPAGQLQKGVYHLERGQPGLALQHYEKAIQWDPHSAHMRLDYAVVLSRLGQNQDALEQLQEACRLEPDEAENHYRLGLAWNEVGNSGETLDALETAVRLDPTHARAWYNLGLARHAAGQSRDAIEALIRAETGNPEDARIPYARATIHLQLGDRAGARNAANRALEIRPDYQAARELLQSPWLRAP